MAEIKFSCSQCGQHISCDEPWSGHQIQCPACQANLTVPIIQGPPEAASLAQRAQVPHAANRPKLSAGLTQVARAAPAGPSPQRRPIPRPPRTQNSLLGYAILAVVLVVVGIAAYNYLPGLLSQVQDVGSSKTSGPAAAPVVGPMGEVNGAMDVSDALEGGAPSRPRARGARQPGAVQSPTTIATNSAAKPANAAPRAR